MKLLIQEYLQTKSFKQLKDDHGVTPSFSNDCTKFSLNYSQIDSVNSEKISQQCRGIILSNPNGIPFVPNIINNRASFDHITPGDTIVLSYGMNRFFNYGQEEANIVNWKDPKLAILEKLDGTCVFVYFDIHKNEWHVGTRSCPEADIFLDNGIFTFSSLFKKTVNDSMNMSFDEFTSHLDKGITYVFELCSPYNRIVVNYTACSIALLAARDLSTMKELDIKSLKDMKSLNIPCAKEYTYTTISELVDLIASLNPMDHEGVVVKDCNFNRLKLKNPSYVAYSKSRDILSHSPRNCLELIFHEKDDDVMPYLPQEIVDNLLRIKANVSKMIKIYDNKFIEIKKEAEFISPGDKKTFALLVQKTNYWVAPFFAMNTKAKDMKNFISLNKVEATWANGFLDKFLEVSELMAASQ